MPKLVTLIICKECVLMKFEYKIFFVWQNNATEITYFFMQLKFIICSEKMRRVQTKKKKKKKKSVFFKIIPLSKADRFFLQQDNANLFFLHLESLR